METQTDNQIGTTSPFKLEQVPEVTYSTFVASLIKSPKDILAQMTEEKANLNHLAVGVCGEAGELLDAVKKIVFYNKELDTVLHEEQHTIRENIIEELGDLEFYMEGIRAAIGVTRAEVIQDNVKKLSKRYRKGFSDKAAEERADKKPQSALGQIVSKLKDEQELPLCRSCELDVVRHADTHYCQACADEIRKG